MVTTPHPGAIEEDWPKVVRKVTMRGWSPECWGRPTIDWEFIRAYPEETAEGKLTLKQLHLLRALRFDLNGATRWISPSHLASWWNLPLQAWQPLHPCLGSPRGTRAYCGNCSLLFHWLIAMPKLDLPVRALLEVVKLHLSRALPSKEVVAPCPPPPRLGLRGGSGMVKGYPLRGGHSS